MKGRLFTCNILFILLFCVILDGCKEKTESAAEKAKQERVIVASMQALTTPIYFDGTIQPLQTISVVSPIDGLVTQLRFDYGQLIEKNQELVVLSSSQLGEDYRKAVNDYLEKKTTYANDIESFEGTEALYKAGVVSREEYMNARSQHENNILNYFQSKYALEKILRKANIPVEDIERLTLADTQQINKILQREFTSIVVRATGSGIALFPVDGQGGASSDDASKNGGGGKLTIGTQVKEGQLLLTIGDLSGLSVKISVNEININQIKTGMPVVVTGDAFPNITLKGKVTEVASQASLGQAGGGTGGTSTFDVMVQIPKVTPDQQRQIHVGMTAKVQINIEQPKQILLPLKAIVTKNGQSMVTIIDKNGQHKDVPVVTGTTTLDQVAIISGVQPGDKVVVHD